MNRCAHAFLGVVMAAFLGGCAPKDTSEGPPAVEAATAATRSATANLETKASPTFPRIQYYDAIDPEAADFRADVRIGSCLAFTATTQSAHKRRSSGLSPIVGLNNHLHSVGESPVQTEGAEIVVIRLPFHGKLLRGSTGDGISFEWDPDYLGVDRLVLGTRIEGRAYELSYYLQTAEDFDERYGPEWCPRSHWKRDDEARADAAPAHMGASVIELGSCSFVYPKSREGITIRTGLSPISSVMAFKASRDNDWDDSLWRARVVAPPIHGQLIPLDSPEAAYQFNPEADYTGVDRAIFEVDHGAQRYRVEMQLRIDPLNPEYQNAVSAALQDCTPFTFPEGPWRQTEDIG